LCDHVLPSILKCFEENGFEFSDVCGVYYGAASKWSRDVDISPGGEYDSVGAPLRSSGGAGPFARVSGGLCHHAAICECGTSERYRSLRE
jgi:hypothetical protein